MKSVSYVYLPTYQQRHDVHMPAGARVLGVDAHTGQLRLHYVGNANDPSTVRQFLCVPAGTLIDMSLPLRFVGMAAPHDPGTLFYVFEVAVELHAG